MADPRILVVEDDPDCADALRETLDASGHRSLWAATPAAALEAVGRDDGIGILVLDLRLPELDGVRLLSRLRATAGARGPSIQGILSSGAATPADLDGAMRSGVLAFLPKPIDRVALLNAVGDGAVRYRALERDRQARAALAERCRRLEGTLTEVAHEVAELVARPPAVPAPHMSGHEDAPGLAQASRALQCRRLQRDAERQDRVLGKLAVDASEWRVLLALLDAELTAASGGMPATSLALASGASASAGLRRIAALEGRGLLERADDPADGRRAVLRLSGAGRVLGLEALRGLSEGMA